VLLIPGLLSDSHVWRHVLEALGGEAEVVDLNAAASISEMAQLCLASGEGALAVAGHSMGARVALEMVRQAPERISRLALLNTGIHAPTAEELDRRRAMIRYAWENGMPALAARWLPPMVYHQSKSVMEGLTQMVLRMDESVHERQVMALAGRPDARSHLAAIKIPCLVMTGAQDRWSPPRQHQDIASLIPTATLRFIREAGHFAPVEQPRAVAHHLAPFLQARDQNSS